MRYSAGQGGRAAGRLAKWFLGGALLLLLWGCQRTPLDSPPVRDAFPAISADVFQPMDGGVALQADEIRGRNTWILWCAGSEAFWDRLARESNGLVDLLKTIDSRRRSQRFHDMGVINEPGFRSAARPDQYGLWIDEPTEPPPATIDPAVYGRSTGLMGFRLFPNPEFQGEAVKRWDAARYYADPAYARDPALVRPYRVGISCAACHVAFNPCHPPKDPENPAWTDLASAIGNQYLREGRTFAAPLPPGGFVWQMLEAQPPGTSDTSRIATDHINNPGAINGIFDLPARLAAPAIETLTGETLLLPGASAHAAVPLALKDGADSAGLAAAILRVYVNIGLDSDDWLQRHDPLLGRTPQEPFSIATAQRNSAYWRATEQKLPDVLRFLGRLRSFRLEAAPGGAEFITGNGTILTRGKIVFAETCARCHSSKRPPDGVDEAGWFREQVLRSDFRDGNFFSDGRRHSVVAIRTNAARSFASNAKQRHIWQNFSSETYKRLPSPGQIEVWNPFTDGTDKLTVPDGGTGYYRTPPLAGIWSTAPFLHNNALGKFTGDPSVQGRMAAFDDAVTKLLWPDKRLNHESVWRTTTECEIVIPPVLLPEKMKGALASEIDADGFLRIGPIPAGTPVNLIANVDFAAEPTLLVTAIVELRRACAQIRERRLGPEAASALLRASAGPALLCVNSCPDFVEDRGHTFGANLSDPDKRALIEYLKTL